MAELINQLKSTSREESIEILSKYKKSELLQLAKEAHISINRQSNKDTIIGQITNHYGYSRVYKAMQQRPDMIR